MKYMMLVKASKEYEAGLPPNPQLLEGFAKLNEEMFKSGNMVALGGLQPSSRGTRLSCTNGKRMLTDGPFAETKELVGGFAILEAKSKEEAIAMADRAVEVHLAAGVMDVEIELRPMMDPLPCSPPLDN